MIRVTVRTRAQSTYIAAMAQLPPSIDDFERMAREAWAALPQELRDLAGDVLIRIEEIIDEETARELEIDEPIELTGLYSGTDLTHASVMDPSPQQPMVVLYRLPILFEWIEHGDVDLAELISHVLVHEVGHHFGISDDHIDQLLEEAD